MNEVTKIHLGRQAFTIAVDAQKDLREYLDSIKKYVKDDDVLNEIELRMAELLSEHGVTSKKVVIQSDIDYLKKQLGNPKDFQEDDAEEIEEASPGKRLYRDTTNAMVAGVASGLSKYTGIDVIIIRIAFILALFITVGGGIIVYLILWLLVPEAKTSSDKLKMTGKPVTVDNIKHYIDEADVKGVANRTGSAFVRSVNSMFKVLLRLCGVVFALFGLALLFAMIGFGTYFLLNANIWSKYNIFPVGLKEHFLLYLVALVIVLIAVFFILFGVSMFRRKWPIPAWATGILIGVTLIALATSGAMTADVYPAVRDRYNSNVHTVLRKEQPFNTVVFAGGGADNINYVMSSSYYVQIQYFGHPNLSSIKTTLKNKVLNVNIPQFDNLRNCPVICIPNSYRVVITIGTPQAINFPNPVIPPYVKPVPQPFSNMQ